MSSWRDAPLVGTPSAVPRSGAPAWASAPEVDAGDSPPERVHPSEGMPWYEKALVGAGAATARALEGVGSLLPAWKDDPRLAQLREDRKVYEANHPGGWATAGEIGADVAMSAIPVAKAAALPRALGVTSKLAAPAADIAANAAYAAATAPENRGSAAAMGGAGAAGGQVLTRALARAARPAGELGSQAQALVDAGVQPTFGQSMREGGSLAGRAIGRAEDAMTSIPVAGSMLQRRRAEALEAFQAATRRDALPPGAPAEAAKSVDDLSRAFNDAYEGALTGKTFASLPAFNAADTVDAVARDLPVTDGQIAQAKRFVTDVFKSNLEAGGSDELFDAATAHRIESMLKGKAANYKSSADASQRDFGQLLHEVANDWRGKWRGALAPADAQAIGALDAQYRQFVPVRRAAKTGSLTDPDKYTPQTLLRAIRASDRGPNKGQFVAGTAPQQKLASAAADLLGSKVNDSGTAERLMTATAIGAPAAVFGLTPEAIGSLLLAMGYSTQVAQKYLTGQLAPAQQKAIEQALRQAIPYASQTGRSAATVE